ncbi:MAG: DUF4416 family protein [Candidatus Aminicenantales bacterium]
MAQPKPFAPVKLICGVIYGDGSFYDRARGLLVEAHGRADLESPAFDFDLTDYYEKDMGTGLKRQFMSFDRLAGPGQLADIKVGTNRIEDRIREEAGAALRTVNIDPGYLTASALVMATAKDFSHRIPLAYGIYAHLEFLFTKTDVRFLDWTYPDMRRDGLRRFFLDVRRKYLEQLRSIPG